MSSEIQKIVYRGADHQVDTPTLELAGVSVSHASLAGGTAVSPNTYALQNISFRAQSGEQMAIVGPNGAGKSTLFKLIIGTLKPDKGQVKMYGSSPDEHICIAYVPQRNQIDWSFPVTVKDVVMMGRTRQIGLFRRARKQDWEIVYASLERVNVRHLADKQIGELSGGQQQRVFIARSLALDTDLLLLDEPLTGLDSPSQEKVFEILASLRSDGVTVLVATHDLNVAAERFDRVLLLNKRIVALGTGTAVLTAENLMSAYGG